MDDDWGHDEAHWDFMELRGGPLGVNIPEGQQSRGQSCLDFHPEGCPAAYAKLRVTDLDGLRQHFGNKAWRNNCVHKSGDQCWLDTYQAIRGIRHGTISGPAAQTGTHNFVPTLVCNRPHPNMQQEFCDRPRLWPSTSFISDLLKLPMLLVLVGHKCSPEFNLQARISWSHLELKLIQELPISVRQGYIACKYVLKCFSKVHRGTNKAGEGRNSVSSYHVKTLFLRYLEKTQPSMITSPFKLLLDLLHELDECLKVRNLPHYFLAQCDLLETVTDGELCITHQAIQEILSDPLKALLTSPSRPQQIYGDVPPYDLVVAFNRVSSHPTCEQSREDLSELLARVDERRRSRYTEQRESDKRNRVTRRAELFGLVDVLKLIINAEFEFNHILHS